MLFMFAEVLNSIMLVLLFGFAALSFRDAWLFRTRGDAHGMALRLPRPLMLATHAIMRRGLKTRHLALHASWRLADPERNA